MPTLWWDGNAFMFAVLLVCFTFCTVSTFCKEEFMHFAHLVCKLMEDSLTTHVAAHGCSAPPKSHVLTFHPRPFSISVSRSTAPLCLRRIVLGCETLPKFVKIDNTSYHMRSRRSLTGIPGYPVSLFWEVPVVFVALAIKMSFLLLPAEESPLKGGTSTPSSKFRVSWDVKWTDRLSIQRKVFGWRRQWGTLL